MLSWKQLILTQIFLFLKTTNFDIVIPLFNAANRVELLLDALNEHLKNEPFRVILVDDFSKDKTLQTVSEIQGKYPFEIELIQLAQNKGQHNATMIGLTHVKGTFAITIDDDLQHFPDQIKRLTERYYQTNADLIYGTYESKKHTVVRNLGSYLLQKIIKFSNPRLVNITSFRLIKKEILSSFSKTTTPIVFIDEYLINYASTVEFVAVEHRKRTGDKSSYSYAKLVAFALNIILFHSSIPLKFITRIGLLMSVVFFGIGSYFIWQKLFYSVQLGYTSIIVSIFFSSGLILFALGIIGEYIRRIWTNQNTLNNIVIRSHVIFER
jgi:glycosyltransferase involved in cell wall biosynthesis